MNFLHLTTFYPPFSFGGDAMYIYRLAHGFGALSPLLTQQTGRPFLKMGRIAEVVKSRRYDVVHYHNISLLGPRILALETPGSKPVKLYTTHEHWLVCPMHVLWKFNSRACEKPECLKCTVMAQRPPQLWRYTGMLEKASRHVDRFVSPSRFTASMHAQRGFSRPVGHLPYFIDRVDTDWQEPKPRGQERPYCLFVGRLAGCVESTHQVPGSTPAGRTRSALRARGRMCGPIADV